MLLLILACTPSGDTGKVDDPATSDSVDTGEVVDTDTGEVVDTGDTGDTGANDTDTGATDTETGASDSDTGASDSDTAVPDSDTGASDSDTAVTDSDTGASDSDTGTTDTDSGTTATDTGTTDPDTATDPVDTSTPVDTATDPIDTSTPTDTATDPIDTSTPTDTATDPIDTSTPIDTATPTDTATATDPTDTATDPVDPIDTAGDPTDADADGSPASTDCDDLDPRAHPGADESCDGVDNNCNGLIDEPDGIDTIESWADADGDGWGAGDDAWSCTVPEGRVTRDGDCDDDNADVNPDAVELCDDADIDEDCDGSADDADPDADAATMRLGYLDLDADGWGGTADSYACDPWLTTADDCDDLDPAVHPGATEVCDHDAHDEDCDGLSDAPSTRYLDLDDDGFGQTWETAEACPGEGYADEPGDCDDDDASINPGAEEACDGIDSDCDGAEFYSEDFYSAPEADRLSLNGDAEWDPTVPELILTENDLDETGSAAIIQLLENDHWRAEIDFTLSAGTGADGLALYLHTDGDASDLSRTGGGSGLGLYDLEGWAIEVDPWPGTYDDIGSPHVALINTGDFSILAESVIDDPRDGAQHRLVVSADSGILTIEYDDAVVLVTADPLGTTPANIGVSAATGSVYERHALQYFFVSCG